MWPFYTQKALPLLSKAVLSFGISWTSHVTFPVSLLLNFDRNFLLALMTHCET